MYEPGDSGQSESAPKGTPHCLTRPRVPCLHPPADSTPRVALRSRQPSALDGQETPSSTLIPGFVAAVSALAVGACAGGSPGTATDQTPSSAAADVPRETGGRIRFFNACADDRDFGEYWVGCLDWFVMAPDGTAKEKLAELTAWTALSPNGTRVAFYRSDSNEDWELFVADVEGTNPTRIASTRRPISPAWSPNGSKLAFDMATEAYDSTRLEELARLGVLTGCEDSGGFDDSRFPSRHQRHPIKHHHLPHKRVIATSQTVSAQ